MTWQQLKKNSEPHFFAIKIDKLLPKFVRSGLRKLSIFAAIFFFMISFGSLPLDFSAADGVFFLCVFTYLSMSFLESFYRSMKDEGLRSRLNERILEEGPRVEYALSTLIYHTDEIDAARVFGESEIGLSVLERAGIDRLEAEQFVRGDRIPVIASSINFETETGLPGFAASIYNADKSFRGFLASRAVSREEFAGAAKMISDESEKKRRQARFWGRENLGSMPSIGTSWAYGLSTELGHFAVPLEKSVNLSALDIENGYREKEVALVEGILARREESNVIIIDDDESVVRDIAARLLKKIKLGVALPGIEHKHLLELDWNALLASFKDKSDLQKEMLQIFNQAIAAGNILLYIRDLPGLIGSAKTSGVNLPSLLSPYLASDALQIVAHAGNADFHYFVETNPAVLERFERVIPEPLGAASAMPAVTEKALAVEQEYGLKFSYGGIRAVAESADRYVSVGEMPGKALDMIVEIAPWLVQRGIKIARERDVSAFVSEKTGIAQGPVRVDEAEKIEKLEATLHKRVIGQEAAVRAVVSAIRRSRSGLSKPERPLASLLFLGPTGVGKTEVSKSLAENFFGDEDRMIRLDMSEYNGPDGLTRLIGSFAENKTGLLASRARDNPYGVLLLDEFEKASPDVLDLFLQILDEGFFSDALGKRVNCRNFIIIATSNAGSQLIWEVIKSGKDLEQEQSAVIETIIKDRVFKPELINRFDATILFHPLRTLELRLIAQLELQKLSRRLKEQEMELVVTEPLLDYLVKEGSDPQFGARALNRAIQSKVEDAIAKKIVSGEVRPGSKIELNISDLQ